MTGGVPLPQGACRSIDDLSVVDSAGTPVAVQFTPLELWPDGSLRWVLLDVAGFDSAHHLRFDSAHRLQFDSAHHSTGLAVEVAGPRVTVRARSQTFVIAPAGGLFETSDRSGVALRPVVTATDASGAKTQAVFTTVRVERSGPLVAVVLCEGSLAIGSSSLLVSARLRFTASPAVSIELAITNPRAAAHPGNVWELGDSGSVLFKEISIQIPFPATSIACIPEADRATGSGGEPGPLVAASATLYQDSSGGDNWQSTVHVNRDGRVPVQFRGYRLEGGGRIVEGRRASPAMVASRDGGTVAASVRHFWQNFPASLEGDPTGLTIGLFPRQWDDLHELQGGERKTHTVAMAIDSPFPESSWPTFDPGVLMCEPEWYARCEAAPSLTPLAASTAPAYERLIDAALDGDDTLTAKRERIDEYGWRNFGDIYADHEAVGHQGPLPLVSHYNNQYDAVAGFAIQFMRSGDLRWFSAMEELAAHVADIDFYHADDDKAAFSHGLFWHTAHYVDAGRSTHRTYSRAAGVSGGPSNEHDYSTGLLLHYLLTGDQRSRAGVLELVAWVQAMDDGRRTVFRFFSRGDTGLASSTVSPDYHGPGRGAGNSIATLLNGFRLTQDRQLLTRAESLIRRCIHPDDDIEARTLLDAERRWSYTVFLQVLGKYLHVKRLLGELDYPYAYARASLVHYGRWMADHEYPYLDRPDLLEYPNETWAAQDIRKAEIFATAAAYASEPDRERMLDRSRFFFEQSVSTLTASATKTLARPVVILLTNGYNVATLQRAESVNSNESQVIDFGAPIRFVPQKARAKRNAIAFAGASALLFAAAILYLLSILLS